MDDLLLEAFKNMPFLKVKLLAQSTKQSHPSQDIQKSMYLRRRARKILPTLRVNNNWSLLSITKIVIRFAPCFLGIFKVVLDFIKYTAEMLIISVNNMQEGSYRILIIFYSSLYSPVKDVFLLWLQKDCSTEESVTAPPKWIDIGYYGLFKEF